MKFLLLISLVFWGLLGCTHPKPIAPIDDSPIKKIREELSQGFYENAAKEAKGISIQVPPSPFTEEALYLRAYSLAFGKMDFLNARSSLKQLLDLYPMGHFSTESQRLLADCLYWQGSYQAAIKEYRKLLSNHPGKGYDSYAQVQVGNCLLLNDKVADALAVYQDVVTRFPSDPMSDSAQLMVANSYLKLQNFKQAKKELQKLVAIAKDKDIQEEGQKAIRQLEEDDSFKPGVSDTQ